MTKQSHVRWILPAALIMAMSCAGPAEVADTPESRAQSAGVLARLEIDSGGLEAVLDDGADWGLSYSAETLKLELGRELTPDESTRVREIMRSSLSEVLTPERWQQVLVEVYSESFTAGELEEIRAFFETPAGHKVLETEALLSRRIEAAGDAVFEEHLEGFIASVDERLAEEFGELDGGATP